MLSECLATELLPHQNKFSFVNFAKHFFFNKVYASVIGFELVLVGNIHFWSVDFEKKYVAI